jgi:RES domain-containing protein
MPATEDVLVAQCCASCFSHPWLKQFVIACSTERGTCSFCGARQVRVMTLQDLSRPFTSLFPEYVDELYRASEFPSGGHPPAARQLSVALQEDWSVFSSEILAKGLADELLDGLLSAAEIRDLKSGSWVLKFSEQAMRTEYGFWNRMFSSDSEFAAQRLEAIGKALDVPGTLENQVANHLSYFAVLIASGTPLFRTRPGCEERAGLLTPHRDLGPNPAHPASRANSDGQYSMYLAELERTAVAESRQSAGALVSIGEFAVNGDLTVVDLGQSLDLPNPFVTQNLSWMLDLRRLLGSVAATMSKPAQTRAEYLVTQFLANIVRAAGYDGIRYPSALNPSERNLVLFKRDAVCLLGSSVIELGTPSVRGL